MRTMLFTSLGRLRIRFLFLYKKSDNFKIVFPSFDFEI